MRKLTVIGGGLAGAEAAWQAAERGVDVQLFEMRPGLQTGAHSSGDLAELVCSNSLGSNLVDRAPGLLKAELRRLNSMVIDCADQTVVPAGTALAVDRQAFAAMVTERIQSHPRIEVIREEVLQIPDSPAVIASGPLTSNVLALKIAGFLGGENLYFFDAIAPIVEADSIDMEIAFRGSRYIADEPGDGDYINCPLNQDEYDAFIDALLNAERIKLKSFEDVLRSGVRAGASQFFEGCLPIEALADRSRQALAYGPLRPVGLVDSRSGKRPYANVQLRQDNLAGSLLNMVGFQTNLTFLEQKRVFRLIPGLGEANFARYGQMHRNTFIYSPGYLQPTLQCKLRSDLLFAGQIIGVEGYAGNIGTGLLAGWNAALSISGKPLVELPRTTMLGALCYYITHASPKDFQPMKANFGLLADFVGIQIDDSALRRVGKRERGAHYANQALKDLDEFTRAKNE